jgi:hypothetical protein
MGIIAWIYRSDLDDCSNGGVSSKHACVCVTNAAGPDEPTENAPAVKLVVRDLRHGKYVHAEPVDLEGRGMYGGCFIDTSDSRFRQAVERLLGHSHGYPIKLHDRTE